eukprot:975260-Karenia_brevis.AAC.1
MQWHDRHAKAHFLTWSAVIGLWWMLATSCLRLWVCFHVQFSLPVVNALSWMSSRAATSRFQILRASRPNAPT